MSKRLQQQVSQVLTRLLMLPVRGYRLLLSPWLGSACRFNPTCSAYALQALEQHGPATGSYLAACRILRCHPWCHGGHDPVPARTCSEPSQSLLSSKKST